jgi:hypothetical protein
MERKTVRKKMGQYGKREFIRGEIAMKAFSI